MKKLTACLISLFLILPLTSALAFKITATQTLHDVIVPDDFSSIQDAINAATSGQSIYVKQGNYQEYLTINKSIAVIGENPATTSIQGNGTQILIKINAHNVNFSGFRIKDAETGFLLNDIEHCRIEGNIIENMRFHRLFSGGTGIYAVNSKNVLITANYITDIYYNAIFFRSTKNSQIANNKLIANLRWSQPIILMWSEHNHIEWNEVLGTSNNEGGIGLLYSNHNTVNYNNIHENDWVGLSLRASNYTIIKGNNIVKHRWWGIMITNSHNATIYHNNFINNTKQLRLTSSENITWSFNKQGNFWSDYTGKDKNHDGIGDVPYTYNNQTIDPHPLAGRFSIYKIQEEDHEYHVKLISNSSINTLEHNTTANTITVHLTNQTATPKPTSGFFAVGTPKNLIPTPHIVYTDNDEETTTITYANYNLHDSDTYRWIYFTYESLTQKVIITNTFPTDLNSDGTVDIHDLIIAAKAYGSHPAHPRWNPDADINQDNQINIHDLLIIALNFGKTKQTTKT